MSDHTIPTFLHIPKTGGTAIISAIRSEAAESGGCSVRVFSHDKSLDDAANCEVFFVIRDPADRITSAFYSRKRMGRPRYECPHSTEEVEAFKRWPHLEPFIHDLADADPAATAAWNSIAHLRPLTTWLVSPTAIHESNVVYIAHLSTLTEEWPRMRSLCGLPGHVVLPTGQYEAHRAPRRNPALSPSSLILLRQLLEGDYAIFAECQSIRAQRGWC